MKVKNSAVKFRQAIILLYLKGELKIEEKHNKTTGSGFLLERGSILKVKASQSQSFSL